MQSNKSHNSNYQLLLIELKRQLQEKIESSEWTHSHFKRLESEVITLKESICSIENYLQVKNEF